MPPSAPAISWILLCDTAVVDVDGRVTAVAIADRLFARHFPAVLPRLTLVARLAGTELDPAWDITVIATAPAGRTQVFDQFEDADLSPEHCIARLADVGAPEAGTYRFDLTIDGRVVGTTLLELGRTIASDDVAESGAGAQTQP